MYFSFSIFKLNLHKYLLSIHVNKSQGDEKCIVYIKNEFFF